MAQHDYVIANGTGAAVRSDLNNALAAIVSQNSGTTEPATTYAYQWWADTTTGLLKIRNGANNAWITLRELDGTLTIEDGTVSAPGLAFASDLNTGVWSPGADQFAIATNGVERVEWGTSEVVFNDGGENYDFRIEGDTNSSLFFVDASADTVEINGDAIITDKIIHSGDTNTAIRFPAADTVSVETGGTERMRITQAGDILFGKTDNLLATTGIAFFTSGAANGIGQFTSSADLQLILNRKTDDGEMLRFAQDGTSEGNISVSGSTVSLNGAHLSRWSQIPGIDPHDKTDRPEILRGTVMSNLDEMCDWIDPESGDAQDNEQLNKTKVSDVEGDKNVAGVFQSWDDDDDTWVNDYYLAMTGDFVIRVAEGVTVERGDLLMSAGDGTAKPQDDDIIRSKTIAKVTSTNVSCTYDDGSYCVPCVLMAC